MTPTGKRNLAITLLIVFGALAAAVAPWSVRIILLASDFPISDGGMTNNEVVFASVSTLVSVIVCCFCLGYLNKHRK